MITKSKLIFSNQINFTLITMKDFAMASVWLVVVLASLCDCYSGIKYVMPNGYDKGTTHPYARPKSSAVEALKSSYNDQNGYNYNFGYDVKDNVYGNYQSRDESVSADPKGVTRGSYSVVEPDGSLRTVNYEADWVNGFRATVSDKNGVTQHGYNTEYGSDNSGHGYGSTASVAKYY